MMTTICVILQLAALIMFWVTCNRDEKVISALKEDNAELRAEKKNERIGVYDPILVHFTHNFMNLQDGESILVYIAESNPFIVTNKWKMDDGLLISPAEKFGTDKFRRWVIDPNTIAAFTLTKNNEQNN